MSPASDRAPRVRVTVSDPAHGPEVRRLLESAGYAVEDGRQERGAGEHQWRALVESAPTLILQLDTELRIVFINRTVVEAQPEELVGQPALAWVSPEDRRRVELLFRESLRTGALLQYETRGVGSDNTEAWYRAVMGPIRSGDTVTGLVLSVVDITEEHRLAEELQAKNAQIQRAQHLESVGQLAGGIAHDFNNLLTGILGFTQFVLRSFEADDPRRQDLEQVVATANRAADLTRQLLAFSRRQPVAPTLLDVGVVVADLERMLGRLLGERIQFTVTRRAAQPVARVDRSQLEQVIVNLVVNARDAMPDGGRIEIAVDNVELPAAKSDDGTPLPAGPHVRLTVADTGEGMDTATRARMFEPFFTTKQESQGTGLGLAQVWGIVGQNGGRIDVESAPGQGTAFRIDLPVAAATPETEVQRRRSVAPPGRGGETILLVEDDAPLLEVARRILTAAGYRVLTATGGEAALTTARAQDAQIDLLLSDVVLAGMSGVACANALRALRPGLAVLYMSGYAEAATLADIEADPQAALLPKPFTERDLLSRVRTQLDRRGG